MCGISGIIELYNPKSSDELSTQVEKMLDELKHRGPDGRGIKIYNQQGHSAVFGHQRLSIIDLSHEADQPMTSRDGNLCIIFNGEIYNYIELRQELASSYQFRTKSDTEVILAAYARWGERMLEKLEGMYAFLIYEKESGNFLGARDPFGIKPFYYQLSRDTFRFASEPSALWKTMPGKPSVNSQIVADYLMFGFTEHTNKTFFQDIMALRGGHSISGKIGNPDSIHIKKWWSPESVEIFEKPEEQVFDAISESVKIHLRSDVPIGGCLSGGIDSGSINYIASKLLGKEKKVFNSITFTETGFEDDESALAASIAKCSGSTQHLVQVNTHELEQELGQLTLAMGEPYNTLSMYAQFKIFQHAQKLGLKVMLDGQGGDEVFGGYPRVAALIFKNYLAKFQFRSASNELRGFRQHASVGTKEILGLNFLFTNSRYMEQRAIRRMKVLVSDELLGQFNKDVSKEYFGHKNFEQAQFMELTKYIIPRLLRYEDRNSMFFGVESRVPMLSRSVVNLGLSLPPNYKVRKGWTKYVMRKAFSPYLPHEIIWQTKKRGFDIPQQKWMNAINKFLVKEMNESATHNRYLNISNLIQNMQHNSNSENVWRVISLQLWLLKNNLSI
ncbi:MAG: asparagine synthase (glutamine-hydrolyzing) [Sphingobacteriales bacterium]|jgi:asparagine synthase (glutamine-hydrolysing)|nr:asparagine synthase (glutamine-hydrolyzing) [Sphingobacteriales bacterium]